MKLRMITISTLLVSLVLNACHNKKLSAPLEPNSTWELYEIGNNTTALSDYFPEKKPTITIGSSSDRISGFGGCNRYSTSIKITNNKIELMAPIASTKMMCALGSEGETVYFGQLSKVNSFQIAGDHLTLVQGQQFLLKFRKTRE